MAYADQQMSGNRITALIIVAVIHIVIGYALVTGLAYEAAQKVIQKVTTIDIKEEVKKEPEPPPPPPKKMDTPPPPQKIVAPPVKIAIPVPAPPRIDTTPTPPPPAPPVVIPPPPAAPPPPRFTPKAATPKGQSGWARRIQENYPSRALREEREGRVGVRVSINEEGRVTSCTVTRPSGSSDLDAAACEGMERYARFNPATDSEGQPTSGSFSTNIVYQLN